MYRLKRYFREDYVEMVAEIRQFPDPIAIIESYLEANGWERSKYHGGRKRQHPQGWTNHLYQPTDLKENEFETTYAWMIRQIAHIEDRSEYEVAKEVCSFSGKMSQSY